MGRALRTAEERALVRSAAEEIVNRGQPSESWKRQYRQMARGTLAALDWLEGLRRTSPASDEPYAPDDVVERSETWHPTAFVLERLRTEDWGSGHVPPPKEDRFFHDAVWAVLNWSEREDGNLAINVPALLERQARAGQD